MKRQISASSKYNDYMTINHGPQKFSVHISYDGPYEGSFAAQISEVHPYDDAEYAWARIGFNGSTDFIKDGKIIDKMQLPTYEDDDLYENVEEYYSDMLDSVAVELMNINKDVKPRMMYN